MYQITLSERSTCKTVIMLSYILQKAEISHEKHI